MRVNDVIVTRPLHIEEPHLVIPSPGLLDVMAGLAMGNKTISSALDDRHRLMRRQVR